MSKSLCTHTAQELHDGYARGAFSPVDVIAAVLARADQRNDAINAFVVIDREGAQQQARASAQRWQAGQALGPLDGVPVSIKDLLAMRGFATRCGSLTTDPDAIATEDSPPVARLREAGAILFGKTHTSEFGWKGLTDTPLHGVTRNPWDLTRSAGGSSGGAGAALAAHIGALAHGTDAGGSVRIPASFCGLYGIKPTFARVPHQHTGSPYATQSCNGALAHSVRDAARMLTVLAQPDDRDWRAGPYTGEDFETGLEQGIKGLRIAWSPRLGGTRPETEVEAIVAEAVRHFEALGATVEEVGPVFDPLRPAFEEYWKAGFAYRLKGIPADKHGLLDPGLLAVAEQGMSVGLDAYYAGVEARARLALTLAEFHRTYDLLITPTTPTVAPSGETVYHSAEFDRWDKAVPYTMPFNLTGQPAASIPAGLSRAGLPVGLQIVGPRFAESRVLQASRAFEQALPFVAQPPQGEVGAQG